MPSYYRDVLGNLNMGDIAKSSDIHHIQRHIKDALKALLLDMHNGDSYVLGVDNDYKNSFVLTAAPKYLSRYIDSHNIFDEETNFFNINHNDIKQPIVKTKTSLYSIVTKMRNTSNKDIPITCELQDNKGNVLRSNTVTLLKNTPSANYEIVFDLDFFPTPPNLSFEDLQTRDGKDIPPRTREESFDEGYEEEHESEGEEKKYFSAGVSKLYFVIKRTNLNAIDLEDSGDEEVVFDAETSLGVYCKEGSLFPDKDIFAEVNGGTTFTLSNKNIYYQDIYANEMTYLCSGGAAVIDGEKVECIDTHISIEGGSTEGNVLTQVYLGNDGHLYSSNKKTALTTNIDDFEDDIDDPLPIGYLPIALILTYSNALYGTAREPLIIQDSYNQLPRSHHERLRRLEKQMDWSNDIALPSRIKYTVGEKDWIDEDGEKLINYPDLSGEDREKVDKDKVFLTTDSKGNLVARLSNSKIETIPVTLKEKLKDSKGKEIKLKETDILNVSSFSKIEHMVHDSKKGTLVLDKDKTKQKTTPVARNKKEAKLTEFNPWDDSAANRPSGKNYEKTERGYTVVSGKNGEYDRDSSYPGMTFYTDSNYKMEKLTIPIYKFKNCSGVKFFIYKRQDDNDKQNTVWLEKLIYTSKIFSLKKAKVKGKYQYMDEGFTINFGKGGLSLPKAQYVIIALPIPKSDKGTLYVETYKPKNSKDFCIRYRGSADAEHFRLTERYQEIWYNPISAIVTEESYYKTGTIISKTKKWTEEGLEKIRTVRPVIGKLTTGAKTNSYTLWVSTGGKWIKVTPNKDNVINDGGGKTFKWKLEFKGNGKSTPKLQYNKKKGFAIQFVLTRDKPLVGDSHSQVEAINKTMCLTSIPFDGDNILREYLGDMNFGLTESRFEGYEFARIWADENLNEKLLIDIQASDRKFDYELTSGGEKISVPVDLWSLHYCDLTLDDFKKISVDYNDYTTELEYDENNMRLKLDSEHSYNDNDIQLLTLKDFTKNKNEIDNSDSDDVVLVNKETVTENQILSKKIFDNPLDLTRFTGLKFKIKTNGNPSTEAILNGIGIYISSAETEEAPSNIKNLPENLYKERTLKDTEIIPKIIDPDESSYPYYEGKLIQIIHEFDSEKDGNKIYKPGFYQYIQEYDAEKGKYLWKRQQVFDLRTYAIFELGTIRYKSGDDGNTFEVRIEVDQNSNNFKHVKEIGLIALNDEDKFLLKEESIRTEMTAECTETGKISVTLKDKDGNILQGKTIKWGEQNENNQQTGSNDGKILATGFTGKGTVTFFFEGFENETTKKLYSQSSLTVDYDFTDNKKEITQIKNESISASNVKIQIDSVKGLSEDYLKIYDPQDTKASFVLGKYNGLTIDKAKIYPYQKITLDTNTYSQTADIPNLKGLVHENTYETSPSTTQINIDYDAEMFRNNALTICYMNNTFEGGLSNYEHIGIQIASDIYIPKDSLKINVCSGYNGEDPIASVNLPTLNTVYYPTISYEEINLSQIFKKLNIEDDVKIKSISISTTQNFYSFMEKVVNETDADKKKPAINLFLGKIVLYKARTIPIYHNKMRFKFYSTTDGEIDHYEKGITSDNIAIRKIGSVLDYH